MSLGAFLAAFTAFLQILPRLMNLIEKMEKELGPEWDKLLIQSAEGYAKLKAARNGEERRAAEEQIARVWLRR
jgi:hypothetical protein